MCNNEYETSWTGGASGACQKFKRHEATRLRRADTSSHGSLTDRARGEAGPEGGGCARATRLAFYKDQQRQAGHPLHPPTKTCSPWADVTGKTVTTAGGRRTSRRNRKSPL